MSDGVGTSADPEDDEAGGLSPCVRDCGIDRRIGLCRGCGRTLDEIVSWSEKTAAERRAIMSELPNRKSARVRGYWPIAGDPGTLDL